MLFNRLKQGGRPYGKTQWYTASRMCLIAVALLLVFALFSTKIHAQETTSPLVDGAAPSHAGLLVQENGSSVLPILTDSPRSTLATFQRLGTDMETAIAAYGADRSFDNYTHLLFLNSQIVSLIDTHEIASATRHQIGSNTGFYLLDILGRVAPIDLKSVPADQDGDANNQSSWRVPGTPFRISMMPDGPRTGEFLFAANTINAAPRFYSAIKDTPLRSTLPITSWIDMSHQLSGPMVPVSALASLPKILKVQVLGTMLWKVLLVIALAIAAIITLRFWHYLATKKFPKSARSTPRFRILSPLAILLMSLLLHDVIAYQINISGAFFELCMFLLVVTFFGAATWAFWLSSRAYFETVILDPTFPNQTVDASMVSLVGQLIGTIGGIFILGYGASELGVPILSLITGLGIGGVAVALAVRPTLENLIGGFVLYLDRPVRVGDYCTFDDKNGTIEAIGVRSTTIRTSERTMITIPNAQFADMHIINWAKCDEMLIEESLSLRYETSPDQLRYVLGKLREMMHAHPRIDPSTVRVRFSGLGSSGLLVNVRVYAKTREWNDFHAIHEDILFRITDIVAKAGTDFAFSSQTIYTAKDALKDPTLAEKAAQQVDSWRKMKQFPFPKIDPERLKRIEGTLKYPPWGSPDYFETEPEPDESSELLSTFDGDNPDQADKAT